MNRTADNGRRKFERAARFRDREDLFGGDVLQLGHLAVGPFDADFVNLTSNFHKLVERNGGGSVSRLVNTAPMKTLRAAMTKPDCHHRQHHRRQNRDDHEQFAAGETRAFMRCREDSLALRLGSIFGFMNMLTTMEGVFEDGVLKPAEQPAAVQPGASVIVTFLSAARVDLRERGIGQEAARELRARLSAFAEAWESPEMAAYDDYHAAKSQR